MANRVPFLASWYKVFVARLLGLFSKPKLKLVHEFHPGSRGDESTGTIRVAIQNSGKRIAKNILVELRIYKPQEISVEYGPFFDRDRGDVTALDDSGRWDVSTRLKPKRYQYRLKSHVFVDAQRPPLEVAHFIVCVAESTTAESLDHEMEWTIYAAGAAPTAGQLAWSGFDLKQRLMGNPHETERVVGHDVPSDGLPEVAEGATE
jgi:hypothetical protein